MFFPLHHHCDALFRRRRHHYPLLISRTTATRNISNVSSSSSREKPQQVSPPTPIVFFYEEITGIAGTSSPHPPAATTLRPSRPRIYPRRKRSRQGLLVYAPYSSSRLDLLHKFQASHRKKLLKKKKRLTPFKPPHHVVCLCYDRLSLQPSE